MALPNFPSTVGLADGTLHPSSPASGEVQYKWSQAEGAWLINQPTPPATNLELDSDLTAIASIPDASTGYLRKTGAGAWSVSALDSDLEAIAQINAAATGYLRKTGDGVWSVSDLDPDLNAIASLSPSAVGYLRKVASNTWEIRELAPTPSLLGLHLHLYVNNNLSDNNDGKTIGTAVKTLQKAILLAQEYEQSQYWVIIHVEAGTYPNRFRVNTHKKIWIEGKANNPGSVIFTGTDPNPYLEEEGTTDYWDLTAPTTDRYTGLFSFGLHGIRGVRFTDSTSTRYLCTVQFGGTLFVQDCQFISGWYALLAQENSLLVAEGTLLMGGQFDYIMGGRGWVVLRSAAVTSASLTTDAYVKTSGQVSWSATTFSISGTSPVGRRYFVFAGGEFEFSGVSGTDYGDTIGSTATGGVVYDLGTGTIIT